MLKNCLIIFFVLLLAANMPAFSDQGGEQQPRSIDQELSHATALRNVGIVLTIAGLVSTGVAGAGIFGAFISATGYIYTGDPLLAEEADKDWQVFAISGICALVSLGVGIPLWIVGARRLWNAKEQSISLQLQGPNFVRGNDLGGISIIYSY